MLRETVVGSAILAALVATFAALSGHLTVGLGLAAGLMIGSANAYAIAALVDNAAPFLAASMLRLGTLTVLALGVAVVFGFSAWPVVMGVGAAQLVMVAAGVRQGLRT